MSQTTQDAAALVPGATAPAPAAEPSTALPLQPVRVLRGFRLPGRDVDPEEGDEFELPRPLALELAMYHKVELIDDVSPTRVAAAKRAARKAAAAAQQPSQEG